MLKQISETISAQLDQVNKNVAELQDRLLKIYPGELMGSDLGNGSTLGLVRIDKKRQLCQFWFDDDKALPLNEVGALVRLELIEAIPSLIEDLRTKLGAVDNKILEANAIVATAIEFLQK